MQRVGLIPKCNSPIRFALSDLEIAGSVDADHHTLGFVLDVPYVPDMRLNKACVIMNSIDELDVLPLPLPCIRNHLLVVVQCSHKTCVVQGFAYDPKCLVNVLATIRP